MVAKESQVVMVVAKESQVVMVVAKESQVVMVVAKQSQKWSHTVVACCRPATFSRRNSVRI